MTNCKKCSVGIAGFESITVSGDGNFCYRCYNRWIALRMDAEVDDIHIDGVNMTGVDGRTHTFRVRSHLFGDKHVVQAIELQKGQPKGYDFEVMGTIDDDGVELFSLLYQRMREQLSRVHVEKGELGWQITEAGRVTGRIDSDLDAPERTPLVIIDGREFTWHEFGRMLMTYEGWAFDLQIRDRIEEVGGDVPLTSSPGLA